MVCNFGGSGCGEIGGAGGAVAGQVILVQNMHWVRGNCDGTGPHHVGVPRPMLW